MSKIIPLSQGKVAIVDDADFEWLSQWKWHYAKGYAVRNEGIYPDRRTVYMHDKIMNPPDGMEVDHVKTGDNLNNQRYNLRICTRGQNMANTRVRAINTSGYKGVTWNKDHGRWQPQIKVNGKRKYLGFCDTAEDAAHVYDEAARKYFGEFAKLNFPDKDP
jgi:hypothetical protein